MTLLDPGETRLREWWARLRQAKGFWMSLMPEGYESFRKAVGSADFVVEYPFGIVYFKDGVEGLSLSLHGLFWSKEVFRATERMKSDAKEVMVRKGIYRLGLNVPAHLRAIGKLADRCGFSKEGTVRNFWLLGNVLYDADQWSMTRGMDGRFD